MKGVPLTGPDVAKAVYGGCILGGGGGGWIEDGMTRGQLAVTLGTPRMVPVEDFDDEDYLVMVSGVGAPSSDDRYVEPVYYMRCLENLQEFLGRGFSGIMTNENGASATVNGWLQSVMMGLPLVDAAGDGRAHPTAVMGSMGLYDLRGYVSCQSAVGGDPTKGRYLEAVVKGSFSRAAAMVRQASVEAGGIVAVARDPLPASYVRKNAAVGAISHAIEVGGIFLAGKKRGADYQVRAVAEYLGGELLGRGIVEEVSLRTSGGFDVGSLVVRSPATRWELAFWNEYMCVEAAGERLATFPDLIMTFAAGSGEPLVSAQIREGMEVLVLVSPKEGLILGESMKRPGVYEVAERATGKEIIKYSFP